ncbi:ribonuclease III [Mycoplasma sp. NEAQ87857]|uniref:ribonuclease III n=1 Tax=Mycoplasma sp. NEAQ87857 TaxID=2683967 RepID=UPI0013191957|nr:ribonuclease III [Mycoplasma sp. NEAQ87857]QGZ97781.1 ribonuclease III [Mycoplasma sp. NEAQ87857]
MKKPTNLKEFFKIYKIIPLDPKIYELALTHASYNPNGDKQNNNYEQLEFLGDAVLQFISSQYIYRNYPELAQGYQTRLRAKAVCTETLGEISVNIGLIDILKTGPGQMEKDVKDSPKVKADIFESMIGAIYIDLGLKAAVDFVSHHIYPVIDKVHTESNKDAKSELQEYFQSFSKENIKYITEQGANRQFFSKAVHDEQIFGKGYGSSKKEAELNAAKNALEKLK